MSVSFDEVIFPEKIDYMFSGGPKYKTFITQTASGYENREGQWLAPLRVYKAASGPKNPTDMQTVLSFYQARMGCLYGFRWKDWADYIATSQPVIQVNNTTFQLQVVYTDTVRPTYRVILKPRLTTTETKLYVGIMLVDTTTDLQLVENTDYTVDYTTGIGTVIKESAQGHNFTWSGEYDLPARFDTDSLNYERTSKTEYNWNDLQITELRNAA